MRTQIQTNRNGAVLPLLAFMMVAMILLLGLMVEMNWLHATHFEAQSASDLSARSALGKLYSNTDTLDIASVDEAKQVGVDVYSANFGTEPITAANLSFGLTEDDKSFQELPNVDEFTQITASRVNFDQRFDSILGSLVANGDIDIPVFSVAEANRIDLILCLDASGSMNSAADRSSGNRFPPGASSVHEPPMPGSRWFALRNSVDDFIAGFSDLDSNLGLVTFGGGRENRPGGVVSPLDSTNARVEVELERFEITGPLVEAKMQEYTEITLGYGTSIFDGLDQAVTLLANPSIPAKRYIILQTDGSQVADRPSEIVAGERAASLGIKVFTIAYGTNGANLKKISKLTGGQSFSANNAEDLDKAFEAISASLGARITQ